MQLLVEKATGLYIVAKPDLPDTTWGTAELNGPLYKVVVIDDAEIDKAIKTFRSTLPATDSVHTTATIAKALTAQARLGNANVANPFMQKRENPLTPGEPYEVVKQSALKHSKTAPSIGTSNGKPKYDKAAIESNVASVSVGGL